MRLCLVTFLFSVFLLSISLLLMHIKIIFNRNLYTKLVCNPQKHGDSFLFDGFMFYIEFFSVFFCFFIFGGLLLGVLIWLGLYILIVLIVLYFIALIFLIWRLKEEDIESFECWGGGIHTSPMHIYMRFKNKIVEKIIYKIPVWAAILVILFWLIFAVIALIVRSFI